LTEVDAGGIKASPLNCLMACCFMFYLCAMWIWVGSVVLGLYANCLDECSLNCILVVSHIFTLSSERVSQHKHILAQLYFIIWCYA
jgi:hypothetical protein